MLVITNKINDQTCCHLDFGKRLSIQLNNCSEQKCKLNHRQIDL